MFDSDLGEIVGNIVSVSIAPECEKLLSMSEGSRDNNGEYERTAFSS